jgi:hypothetical protein
MPSLTLAHYADPSGDAFETMRKASRALGLPVALVINKDGCEVAAVEGGAKWDSAEARVGDGGQPRQVLLKVLFLLVVGSARPAAQLRKVHFLQGVPCLKRNVVVDLT